MARRAPAAPLGGGQARGQLVNPVGGSARVDRGGSDLIQGAGAVAQFAAYEHDLDVQRDNLVAARLQEEFKRTTADQISKLDPLAANYNDSVGEIFGTAKDDILSRGEFRTRRVSDAFSVQLESQMQGGLTLAEGARRVALDAEGKRLRGEIEDSVYANIRSDPDGFDAYLQEFAVQAARVNSTINPKDRPVLDAKFADAAVIARAEGYAQQGRFDEAKTLIDAHQNSLSPETYRNGKRMIREQETQQRQESLASTAAQVATIEVGIIDAKTTADYTRLRGQVESLDAAGFFRGREEKKVSLIRQIEAGREVLAREQNRIAVRLEQYDAGLGSNTQQDADLVWEQVAARHKAANPEASTDNWVTWAGQFAARSGWVPSQFRNLMANAERTDNVELVEMGARLYDRFRAAAPEADTGTREKGSRVRLASAARELLGLDYGQAAQLVLDRAPDEATLKARQKRFDEDFKEFDPRVALVDAGIGTDGWFSAPDAVPEPVARAYERTLRLHYDLVGDPQIAKAAANKRFREEYGVTSVGGQRAVVRLPPENFFPGAANTSLTGEQKAKIIDADVGRALKALGIEPGVVVEGETFEAVVDESGVVQSVKTGKRGDVSGVPPYQLAADQQTERDRAAGRPPSYELRVRNSFGVMVPVPVEKDGQTRNLRYSVPTIEQLMADPTYSQIGKEEADRARNWKDVRDNVLLPDMRRFPYGPRKK